MIALRVPCYAPMVTPFSHGTEHERPTLSMSTTELRLSIATLSFSICCDDVHSVRHSLCVTIQPRASQHTREIRLRSADSHHHPQEGDFHTTRFDCGCACQGWEGSSGTPTTHLTTSRKRNSIKDTTLNINIFTNHVEGATRRQHT